MLYVFESKILFIFIGQWLGKNQFRLSVKKLKKYFAPNINASKKKCGGNAKRDKQFA